MYSFSIEHAREEYEIRIRRSANLQPGGHDESGGVLFGVDGGRSQIFELGKRKIGEALRGAIGGSVAPGQVAVSRRASSGADDPP